MRGEMRMVAVGFAAVMVAAGVAGCGRDSGGGSSSGSSPGPASSTPVSAPSATAAPPAAPAPPQPPSDDEQIRQTLMAYQDAYNTENWPTYNELMCQKMRAQYTGPTMDSLKKTRADNGLTQIIAISDIIIDGTKATATMDVQNEALGRQNAKINLAQDEDGWKVCMWV